MLRLWNKLPALLCAILAVSCGFMDLRPIGVSMEPDAMNALLPEQYSPVILKFDTEINKNDAEGILQINSDYGSVSGDKFWEGNDLYFVPASGWTAGIRYTLSLNGTIRSCDGRELRIERFIPFFAINKNAHPVLEKHSPLSGASVGTNNINFEFYFSQPMDRLSVESALTLEGIGNKTFIWFSNDQVLKVASEKTLSPWIVYNWNLKDSARSVYGVPLPKTYSGFFTTDLDQTLPEVTAVYPALFSEGSWYPTGAAIENGLRQKQGIAVVFNKTMGENALRSLRFEPSLSGRTEFLSDNSIVYIPSRDPEPETTYTLIVSGDTRDSEGLKIGADYKINFIPDIPFLKVIYIKDDNGTVLNNFSGINNLLQVYVEPAAGKLSFSIYFSLPFGFEEKLNAAQRITLVPFFPRTISSASLQFAEWISEDRLYMRWEGLAAGDINTHYYSLTIPGGKAGISSETGIYMKEDITIILEVKK